MRCCQDTSVLAGIKGEGGDGAGLVELVYSNSLGLFWKRPPKSKEKVGALFLESELNEVCVPFRDILEAELTLQLVTY